MHTHTHTCTHTALVTDSPVFLSRVDLALCVIRYAGVQFGKISAKKGNLKPLLSHL